MPLIDPLLITYGPALARVAGHYARTPSEREDLLQDIVVAAWRALPTFRGDCSPRTFLLRVAHNRAISWSAQRRAFEPEVETAVDVHIDQQVDARQRRIALERAVRGLPEGQRQVVVLVLEDLSHAEIAEVLGITENNVAVRLNRARDALRHMLGGNDER